MEIKITNNVSRETTNKTDLEPCSWSFFITKFFKGKLL